MNIKIIPYDEKYASEFKELNVAWLEKYFFVEPHDEEVLGDPQKYIIAPGGQIFFAKVEEEVVGTLALMKVSEGIYELTKMAVTPKFQGQKIGQKLLEFSIDFAKEQQWKELILYSNRKLQNAIYLYRKFGFEEIPIEENNPYARGDIKMKLKISSEPGI